MTRFLSLIAVVIITITLSVTVDRLVLKDEVDVVGNTENVIRKVDTNATGAGPGTGTDTDTGSTTPSTVASTSLGAIPSTSETQASEILQNVTNLVPVENWDNINETSAGNSLYAVDSAVKDKDASWEIAVCPELHKAIQYIADLPSPPPALNVSILQLVGSWNDNYTSGVMQTVFEHNANLVATRFGFGSKAVTNLTECMGRSETVHPAFCKILAVREYCIESDYDLVWFLDGDVVLMNPQLRIEFLWVYYQQYYSYSELDALFATDWLGLNSGSFVVNCTSPTALRLLEYWDIYAPRANRWKKVWNAMLEQNGIQWLIQDENWRRTYPRHKRDNKLLRSSSEEEKRLFSVAELQRRVAVVNQTCQMATFPVDFWCDARQRRDFYEHKGPVWWEAGHMAVHTAGTRDATRRLPYLLARVKESAAFLVQSNDHSTPPPSIQTTAREYLDRFGVMMSNNPLNSLDVQQCKREQRQVNQEAKERLEAKLNKTVAE